MTDKRDAVVEALRNAVDDAEIWTDGSARFRHQKMKAIRSTLAALDSPLPSDEELFNIFKAGRPNAVWADDNEAKREGRRAIGAYFLRLAANHIGVRSELVVGECVEAIDKLAVEMEHRK